MPIHEYSFGEPQRPHFQIPLRRPVGEDSQERWIVAVWGKERFSLIPYHSVGEPCQDDAQAYENKPYADLWDVLSALVLSERKWWLIGHGTGYALDRADLVGALERGDVSLPVIAKGKNKGKHGGKLTLSRRITEVDLLCGKNKIKMLDWQNYGLPSTESSSTLDSNSLNSSCQLLRAFLSALSAAQVQVNKTTAAQLGWSKARSIGFAPAIFSNLDPECRALERRAYHAGRNECFRLGRVQGETHSLDIKSCYASICLTENLPVRMIEEYRHGLDVEEITDDGASHWIADVVVSTESADYPLQWLGTPIYPVGTFRTALPWPELRRALASGHVQKVLRAARYEAYPVLKEYAQWYLESRLALNSGARIPFLGALKAMFNASLGYTARQKYEWVPWDTQIGHPYWIGIASNPEQRGRMLEGDGDACETFGEDCGPQSPEPVQAQKLGSERRWLRVGGEPREAMPFLHATICSYARMRLLDIFGAAGRETVLYCDTDGILVTAAGREAIERDGSLVGDAPGKLVQRFAPGRAYIQGQKSYRVGNEIIHAGIVDTRRSALAFEDDAIACNVEVDTKIDGGKVKRVRVLTCKTGRPTHDGAVHPFRFDYVDGRNVMV